MMCKSFKLNPFLKSFVFLFSFVTKSSILYDVVKHMTRCFY